MHAHIQNPKINMLGNCKWPPLWRHPYLSCLTYVCLCVHVCVHVYMHMCMGVAPIHSHPNPLPAPRNQVKYNNTNQDNSNLFKDFKSVETLNLCIDGWVNGWGHVKSLKIK